MPEKKLNKQQRQAIHHRRGPLLVIAGAGTGKTTVITERVKWLIVRKLARPDQILALTFTEKAAREMETRIDQALPYGYTQMWVMTFHSFCDRILRDEGLHIGLSPDFKLLTTAGSTSLLRRHIMDFNLDYFCPLGNPHKFISSLLDHFDRLRDEDITPEQYFSYVKKHYSKIADSAAKQYHELASLFLAFQNLKHRENCLDFSDLISLTLKLFRTRPHLLTQYQNRFKHILVDEYQDTNLAQVQLIDLLVNRGRNLTVVADDDQSIYRWRGAAISNVMRFRDVYPDASLVVLTQNYRSSQAILDAAYRLIQFNNPDRLEIKARVDKHLKSVAGALSEPPVYLHFDRLENEVDGVAGKIADMLSENPLLHPGDIAILVRANAHAHPFITALSRRGIPAQFLGPARLFDRPEIKDLVSLLRVIRDPTDSAALFRVLSMDFFNIPPRDLVTVSNYAHKQNLPLLSICENLSGISPPLSPSGLNSLRDLAMKVGSLIEHSLKFSPGEILFEFLQTSGLLSALLEYRHPINAGAADNISRFFARIKSFESENPDCSVSDILDWIDLAQSAGDSPAAAETDWSENDSVNLLTVHSAKGLEFPVVFLVNLVTGRFPSLERKEQIPVPDPLVKEVLPVGDFHLQEERRLFYVGLTRAKNRLFLTASDYYGEAKRVRRISPFISETLGESAASSVTVAPRQLSLVDWQPPQFSSPTTPSLPKPSITYISYSQIQTFLDCPLHYRAKYLLKIPSPPSAASSFGNTIHKTLKDYYQAVQAKTSPDILAIFSHNWTPEGYLNSEHAQKYFDTGSRYLTEFISHRPFSTTPVALEQPFVFHLGKLKVGGKIDRVDILPDGILEIIDYKTGTKELDVKSASRDLQLSFYALAATSIRQPPFNRRPDQVKLSLYYFDSQTTISVFQTADQLAAAKQQIVKMATEITNSDFRCSGSLICHGKCDYPALCDVYLNK